MDPTLFPPGSRIIRLKPGQRLPKGCVPLPYAIDEGNSRRGRRLDSSIKYKYNKVEPAMPVPGDSNYEFKYAPLFEKYMTKRDLGEERNRSNGSMEGIGSSMEVSESSSESVQIKLPPQ